MADGLRNETMISNQSDTKIAFLGFFERATYISDGNTNMFKWNVLGLKQVLISYIFPLPLNGFGFAFAFFGTSLAQQHHFELELTDEFGKQVGTIDIRGEYTSADVVDTPSKRDIRKLLALENGWTTMFQTLSDSSIVIEKPGLYFVRLLTDEGPKTVGQLYFAVLDAPPLTPDRIAAIRSDPNAAKAVQLEIACKLCHIKCRAYAALDRSQNAEAEGWMWYQDLPDSFSCKCSKTVFDLTILRRNFHGILGYRRRNNDAVSFVSLYEKNSLETIRLGFVNLIASGKHEEQFQKFIEENPVLLHQFPAERILRKPAILSLFVADFAIITPQRELLLVEIEKPTTKLMKKDGGMAAELTHAFDQVRDWLHTVDEHRLAVLECLKIEKGQVAKIRGLIIAGRDFGYDAYQLRKLKGTVGQITFLTYDDLVFALDALIREIDAL